MVHSPKWYLDLGLDSTLLGENLEHDHCRNQCFTCYHWNYKKRNKSAIMIQVDVEEGSCLNCKRWQHRHKCLLCIMASCTRKTSTEEQ